MNEFSKISKWVSEVERSLEERRARRAALEDRVARKLTQVTRRATQDEFLVNHEKVDLLKRLARYARIVSADDVSDEALKRIEKEVEETYSTGLSENDTYYFGRRDAGVREEMEALTTYSPEDNNPTWDWQSQMEPKDSVRSLMGALHMEEEDMDYFEDDGEYIDNDDMIDLDIPGPYDFGPQRMLNERDPEDF